jgi:hypothetical protein
MRADLEKNEMFAMTCIYWRFSNQKVINMLMVFFNLTHSIDFANIVLDFY